MKKIILFSILAVVIVSCSKKEEKLPLVGSAYIIENLESMPYNADTILPAVFAKHNLKLSEAVTTVRPIELLAKSPKKAEEYLKYHLIGLSLGEYTLKDNKFSTSILQFADEIKAYAYYASLRPHGTIIEKIGAETFTIGNSRYMVKSDYVVGVSVEENSEPVQTMMRDFIIEIDNTILGSQSTPPFFLLFPYGSKIIPSNKHFPYQYMGVPGVDEVYTTSYLIDSDTLTLFLTMDLDGNKFKYLREYAREHGEVVEGFNRFDFDSTFSIAFKDSTYGVVVAGIKSQKLIGTILYNPKVADKHLSGWIKGL